MAWASKAHKTPRRESKPDHAKLYNDHYWKKASRAFRALHPLCAECERQGVVRAGTEVDHIVPHRGDYERFWDSENNWQVLCGACHSRKSAGEK